MSFFDFILLLALVYGAYWTGRSIGRLEENHRCRMPAWDAENAAWGAGELKAGQRIEALAWKIFDGRDAPIEEKP